jgi:hypothetical protein
MSPRTPYNLRCGIMVYVTRAVFVDVFAKMLCSGSSAGLCKMCTHDTYSALPPGLGTQWSVFLSCGHEVISKGFSDEAKTWTNGGERAFQVETIKGTGEGRHKSWELSKLVSMAGVEGTGGSRRWGQGHPGGHIAWGHEDLPMTLTSTLVRRDHLGLLLGAACRSRGREQSRVGLWC